MLSRAVLTVNVYRMEMAVFRATIFPNLANGIMMQKKRGIVAMTVVMALETMATPTCLTAARVLHFPVLYLSCELNKAERQQK